MNFENLIHKVQVTHDSLHAKAAKAVNTTMTIRNWHTGIIFWNMSKMEKIERNDVINDPITVVFLRLSDRALYLFDF